MKPSNSQNLCPLCGGRKEPGTTTFSTDTGVGVVVVRNVRATLCAQCGEEWIDQETARNWNRSSPKHAKNVFRWK